MKTTKSKFKPHKGRLKDWRTVPWRGAIGLGYLIEGTTMDHPVFKGRRICTSPVVKREGNEIETCNSRYTLMQEKRE